MTVDISPRSSSPTELKTKNNEEARICGPIPFKIAKLSSEQRSLLEKASLKSQAIRRQLAKGSHVLIVQGGYVSKRFIYERIKELGCTITLIDRPLSPLSDLVADGVVDHFVEVDFSSNERIFERTMAALADDLGGTYFDAVTTYFERAVPLAARIAEALGVAVNSITACNNARNKHRTREVMAAAGLETPKYYRITDTAQVERACEHVSLPAVMKPAYGANSFGVTRVTSFEEAYETYTTLVEAMVSSGNDIYNQGSEVLLEELYEGDEFDVDVLLCKGEVVYAKVLDNWSCWPPHFLETGRNAPSIYPISAQQQMIKLAVDAVLALGFHGGVLHVEIMFTRDGARLIEVNARLGGGSVRDMHLYAWGVDLVEEHVLCALGIPIRPLISASPLMYLAESLINAPYSGTINSDDWLGFARADSHLHSISYKKKINNRVQGPEDGPPDYLARLVTFSASNGKEALEAVQKIVTEQAVVPITADSESEKRTFFFPGKNYPFAAINCDILPKIKNN